MNKILFYSIAALLLTFGAITSYSQQGTKLWEYDANSTDSVFQYAVFTPDGSHLITKSVTAGKNWYRDWNVQTGEYRIIPDTTLVLPVDTSKYIKWTTPDGRKILEEDGDTLVILDAISKQRILILDSSWNYRNYFGYLGFSADSKYYYRMDNSINSYYLINTIFQWDITTGKLLNKIVLPLVTTASDPKLQERVQYLGIYDYAFRPKDNLLVTSERLKDEVNILDQSYYKTITRITKYRLDSLSVVGSYDTPDNLTFVFGKDPNLLLTKLANGKITLIDMRIWQIIETLNLTKYTYNLNFAPDNNYLLCAIPTGKGDYITLYSLIQNKVIDSILFIDKIGEYITPIEGICISNDIQYLSCFGGGGGFLEMFKISTIGIQENNLIRNFQFFPNPNQSLLHVQFNLNFPCLINIDLTDLLGNNMSSLYAGFLNSGFNDLLLNLGIYPSGTYFLRFSGNNITQSFQIILTK